MSTQRVPRRTHWKPLLRVPARFCQAAFERNLLSLRGHGFLPVVAATAALFLAILEDDAKVLYTTSTQVLKNDKFHFFLPDGRFSLDGHELVWAKKQLTPSAARVRHDSEIVPQSGVRQDVPLPNGRVHSVLLRCLLHSPVCDDRLVHSIWGLVEFFKVKQPFQSTWPFLGSSAHDELW